MQICTVQSAFQSRPFQHALLKGYGPRHDYRGGL